MPGLVQGRCAVRAGRATGSLSDWPWPSGMLELPVACCGRLSGRARIPWRPQTGYARHRRRSGALRLTLPPRTPSLFFAVAGLLALTGCGAPQGRASVPTALPPRSAGLVPPNGSLASAHIYEAQPAGQPVLVYRVYTAAPGKARAEGSYWAPVAPSGSQASYRRDYVICPEWNDLDRLRVCELKTGAVVAMGPGAAAKCSDGRELPASPVPQILLIPKWDPQLKQYALPVANCSDSTPTWSE